MASRIRIIGGQWRGRKLVVPELPGLRPTGDRVRETLFNWLQSIVPGARCLDLFAGTGALGLEALSRGASEVVFVERDRRLAEALRAVSRSWPGGERMRVFEADVLSWLDACRDRFDVVFVDPPFAERLHRRVLERLGGGRLADAGRIYLEQDSDDEVLDPGPAFDEVKSKRVGRVRMTLLGGVGDTAL